MINWLRDIHEKAAPHFEKGGKFEFFYPIFEVQYAGLFTQGKVTRAGSHVRDGMDLKRMMITVVIALVPCMLMAMWNTGYQAQLAMAQGAVPLDSWQMAFWQGIGLPFDFKNPLLCILFGTLHYLPVYVAAMGTGAIIEPLFAMIRKHEVNEGFLVSGALIPLILPPTIPLWMVVLGTAFGLVLAKEIFGGTGMNFLNPALVARAFLFFAYPAYMSGDAPWIAADFSGIDSFSGATLLSQAAATKGALAGMSWWKAFYGWIPGSMGETSALACLLGALLLLWTRIGSYRTMAGLFVGTITIATLLNIAGSDTNPMFAVPWHWHMVLGGWAFGMVFMATDPVSSAYTDRGKWFYGFGIGALVVLIRVVNPAYPEGMMLAILFMNMFAPLIDHFVLQANIKRRVARSAI